MEEQLARSLGSHNRKDTASPTPHEESKGGGGTHTIIRIRKGGKSKGSGKDQKGKARWKENAGGGKETRLKVGTKCRKASKKPGNVSKKKSTRCKSVELGKIFQRGLE